MRTLLLFLIPMLLLGVYCSIQKPIEVETIEVEEVNCSDEDIEYYCKLNNYKLIWEK